MRYNHYKTILLVMMISLSSNLFSQDLKLKKSIWKSLMEDLRLRKNSLELEKEYLKNILSSTNELDSLKNLLDKCSEQNKTEQSRDTLNNNQDLSKLFKGNRGLLLISGKSEIIRGLIKLSYKQSIFGMNYKFYFSNFF